jgi:DNA-binding response OmpR family regulator
MAAYRIMLIEDDDALSEIIEETLERYGFSVFRCEAYENVRSALRSEGAAAVLIDINLPKYDGFELCRQIREESTVPIIFLSARDSSMDIVMAHSVGGDDYLTKPFDMEVLVAKIHAFLRRAYGFTESNRSIVEYDKLILDLSAGTLSFGTHREQLTRNEKRLLSAFMKQPKKIIGRSELEVALWEDDVHVDENTLTVNVNRVRAILKRIEASNRIRTVRGSGYSLE